MEILENGWFKFDFEKTDGTYTFRDAIHLPPDHNLTDDEIEAMKQQRFDNWLSIINTPAENVIEAPVPVDNVIDVEPKEVNG
jgi:hypothetical protein